MKVVALICLLLLSPVLAMENSFTQLHYDCIKEGKKQVTELQEESLKTLLGRKDSVTLVKNRIDKKRQRLRAPETFLEELDNLLKLLPHPEDLLTIEQRRALIGFPTLEHFQPVLNVIEHLRDFIEKWQSLTAYAEVLQLAANQTIWYEHEWTMLAQEMGGKLTQKTLCCEDLLKIYRYTSYFHAEGTHLATSYRDLKSILQKMTSLLPKDLVYLDSLFNELTSFLHVRGSALWDIIRYSNLIITTEEVRNLPGNYDDLPNDFFLNNANFIKKILSETDPSSKVTTINLGSSRQDPASLKSRSPHSLPMSPQLPSLSRVHKSSSLIRHSRSDSSLPIFPRAKEKMPELSIEEKLQKVFTQPSQWKEYVIDIKEKILLLIHANFIVDPLGQLLNSYDNFRLSYLRNHTEAFDILSPKAFLDIPGHPLIKIPQTRARKVCGLKSNGHLCFNLPECDEETVLTFNNCIDDLVFKKRRELYPASTREQILQFWFEKLFALPSDPIRIGACGDVSFYTPKGNQKPNLNFYSEIYVTNPDAWEIQQNLDFVTIHRKHKGGLLNTLLNQIAAGESSFKEQLDEIAIGVRILFGFSTKECASPENFGLVKNKRKFGVKRVSSNSFLQPLFMVREDKNHHFIGHNIFYFLPYIDEKIPEGVKKIFIDEIFPSLFLSLGTVLTHLTELQKNFNEFILKYKLTEEDELKDMLETEAKLSKADVLGLTLTARTETIQEFIQNSMIIEKQLSSSEITYRQIWRALRPVELDCYEQVFENARKKTQTTPIFFTKVIFSLIERLRRAHENMVGEAPPYTMEELDLFEKAAILYRQKIMARLKEIDTLNDLKMSASSQKENIEIIQLNNEREISILREKLLSLDDTKRTDIEQVETIKRAELLGENVDVTPIPEAGLLSNPSSTEAPQREELLKRLEKEIKKEEENKLKLHSLLEELEKIDQSLKELYTQLSPEVLLKEPLDQVSQYAHTFLKEKYKWAEKNHIFHANIVLKAWESLFDAEKPVIYEKLIKSASSPDWAQVPVLTQNRLTTVYAQLVESDHPIESMVQDLIDHADISSLSPYAALELLDRLLALKPQPETYHKSWVQMVEIARKEFLGMPPRVRSFLRILGLKEEVELRILEAAQLKRYEICGQQIRNAASSLKKFSTPEQFAYAFFHQLWQGSLELSPDNQLFLDGLIKLFSLPLHGTQTSAGFAINPESKGGIFDLRYKVGDHYLLIDTTDWIKLFQSSHILPTQIRLDILSNPLWYIQYLDSLKQLYPDILSHPWYPKTIISKMKLLHDLLQTGLSFTFNDIISAVWPEFHFAIQQKLKSHNNDIDLTLKAENTRGINQLTPIEHKGINLDYPEQGKNMFSLLKEWDEEHLRCISASSLSLDDAATEWLAHIIPENYGPEILARMLDLATRFTIDPSKIRPDLWANPKILTELVRINAPIHCLQLATALRAGLSFKEVSLIKKPTHYQISGLKGNLPLISELICLFPEVTSLNLSHNQLRSLKPLVSSLKSLSHLTNLNVSNNPIHNPAPLAEFPELTDLNIEYTGIPDVSPQGLKELIAREKRVKIETIKLFEAMRSFQSGPSKKQQSELGESEVTLIKRIRTYMKHPDRLPFQDIDAMISILEQLGEVWWLHTLVLSEEMISLPCDELFNLCKDFDPRVVLGRLLFAIKYRLPHGTNRDTLSFVDDIPSMQTDCLRRLDVSNACINQKFLQSLSQFENLFELRLNKVQLTNLNDLPKLPQLKILHLGNNNITTLLGLHTEAQETKFPELNVLILAQNKIVSDMGIRFLLELGKLTFLDLSNNCLTQMPSLGNLFLQRIFLNHNKIPLRELTNYQEDENHKYRPQNQ